MKRVVGLAGDTIRVENGYLYVNGEKQEEDYTLEQEMNRDTEQTIVPEGCYYVMGDNRNGSTDSRNSLLGMVDERYIVGHVLLRIWPLGAFGPVD